MTDPLSPEEIARRRTASYFVEPADAGEEMRRLLDIAADHARLCALGLSRINLTSLRDHLETVVADRNDLRDENDKLRERVGRLEMCRQILAGHELYCEHLHHDRRDLHQSGDPCPVEQRIKAALAACEEGPT